MKQFKLFVQERVRWKHDKCMQNTKWHTESTKKLLFFQSYNAQRKRQFKMLKDIKFEIEKGFFFQYTV